MGFLAKLFGPPSKYDASLPYTYEARVPIFAESEEYKSYFSDTVCGLIEHLHRQGIRPGEAKLLEIYREKESPIDASLFATPGGEWLFKPDICRAFEEHYKGHIHGGDCSFSDRDRDAVGP
jgi:hypothetical protein